jgi:two-component system sensor histidine kinase KdpD
MRTMARPPLSAGVVAAVLGVAAATALIFALREVAPVLALGVVYVLVVLVISTYWGLALGIATALLSAMAYNFFHIPPTGRFTIASSDNWVGLLTFLAVAGAASAVADLARERAVEAQERREEADLAADAARTLLGGTGLEGGLAQTAHLIAAVLGLPSAQLVLGAAPAGQRRTGYPLSRDGATIATLVVPAELTPTLEERLRTRIVPALEALLAAAIEREALLEDRVETVALRRSDELKTAILRSVSHDLRSPLTAMVSSGEALGSPALDDEDRAELSRAVVEAGARLERLIGKLLDLSRLEAGEADPHLEWVDLAEVLTAARDDTGRPDLVTLQLDRDLPALRADAAQLERAFANLMENAQTHGGEQPVSVRARAVGRRLVVRVVDRGPGVPLAEQERIFTPFYRGDRARASATGSGLGLAIVRGFVRANGGTVRVESLPGQGASFVVDFALGGGAAAPSSLPPERQESP